MSDLSIAVVEWTRVGQGRPEEVTTSGLLRIQAGGICLTRNESTWSKSVSDHIHVSLYPAALWFAANWWRICFEPSTRPLDQRSNDDEWRLAHELPAAGRGFLWPSIAIAADGESVLLGSRPTRPTTKQPIRYLETAEVAVSLQKFQLAVDDLVDTVVARLLEERLSGTELELLWHEVKIERADCATARARQFEAMMHCDPDEAPKDGLTALEDLVQEAGLDATNELAGALRRQNAASILEQIKAATADGHVQSAKELDAGLRSRCRSIAMDPSLLPWQRGVQAARTLRTQWRLGTDRLASDELEQRLGLPSGTLATHTNSSDLPVSLAVRRKAGLEWILRSHPPRLRRFEAARLLGDVLGSPATDAWHPATDLRTARQKYQRAFAAEVLCPVEGLRDFLGTERSEEAVLAAAEHFQVSELLVEHQVQNHLDEGDG